MISSNGDKWFRMRRLLTPAFHFGILRSYVSVFQDSTNVLLVSNGGGQSANSEILTLFCSSPRIGKATKTLISWSCQTEFLCFLYYCNTPYSEMAALEFFVWLGFQRKSSYHITKHYQICYPGRFQHLGVNGCKVLARLNLRHLYWKSQ